MNSPACAPLVRGGQASGLCRGPANQRPLVGREDMELRLVDGRPIILQNATGVAGIGIPGPVRIADPTVLQERDQTALPNSFDVGSHRTAAEFAEPNRSDTFLSEVRPMRLPDPRQVIWKVRRGEPRL